MAIPDYQKLMLPVLTIAAQGETRVPLAADKVADTLGLTVEEREEMLPSGKQRLLHNRIHWAKFHAVEDERQHFRRELKASAWTATWTNSTTC